MSAYFYPERLLISQNTVFILMITRILFENQNRIAEVVRHYWLMGMWTPRFSHRHTRLPKAQLEWSNGWSVTHIKSSSYDELQFMFWAPLHCQDT